MSSLFIDAHLHLQDQRFAGLAEIIIDRARGAGVRRLFCNAVNEADWPAVSRLAAVNPEIVPFLGLHPWFSEQAAPGWQDRLRQILSAFSRGAGIGETGLDRSCSADFAAQRALFRDQLELAAQLNLPVSIHCVRAWGPLVEILLEFAAAQKLRRVMIHSFTGSLETMRRLAGLGCYISYSEALLDPRQDKLRETFKQTPVTLLLLETDAPFKKNPDGEAKSREQDFNEPADIVALYRCGAGMLALNMEEFSSQLYDNAAIFTNQAASR